MTMHQIDADLLRAIRGGSIKGEIHRPPVGLLLERMPDQAAGRQHVLEAFLKRPTRKRRK